MSAEFDYLTATEMRNRIIRKEISPVEVTRRALEKADATRDSLNAFFVLLPEAAIEAARNAEDAVMKGAPCGLLHGVPFSTKDLIAVGGVRYASGSRAMAGNVAPVDAPSVERARRRSCSRRPSTCIGSTYCSARFPTRWLGQDWTISFNVE